MRPRTSTRNERLPLWPTTTFIEVGSPTKQADGLDAGGAEMRDQGPHADAADLLVMGKRQVDRRGERARDHLRHRRQTAGEIALHVGCAAAMQAAAARGEAERVVRPGLAVDRNHVGMPRQDIARPAGGPDRRPQVGLGAGLIGDALMRHTEPVEIGLDPPHDRQIGVAAGAVEAHQGFEDLGGLGQAAHAQAYRIQRIGTRLASAPRPVSDWRPGRAEAGPARSQQELENGQIDAILRRGAVERMDRRGRRPGAQDRPLGGTLRDRSALPQPDAQQLDDAAHLRHGAGPGRAAADQAAAGGLLEDGQRHHLGVQAAAGREVHRRLRLHRQRRDLLVLPRAADREFALLAGDQRARHHRHDRARSADAPGEHGPGASAAAERDVDHRHPVGEGERRRRGHLRPPGLQGRRHLSQDRGVQLGRGGDRQRPVQARPLHQGRPHHPGAQRGLLGREAGLAARRLPADHQRRPARRRAARRRRRPDRERADPGPAAGQVECRVQGGRGPLQPRHLPAFRLSRRADAGRGRHRRQEPVPRQARARGDLQGDRPRRHRGAHHGRRGGGGRRAAAAGAVRRQQGHEGAQARSRRRQEAARRSRLSRTASRWCWRRPTTATSTTR